MSLPPFSFSGLSFLSPGGANGHDDADAGIPEAHSEPFLPSPHHQHHPAYPESIVAPGAGAAAAGVAGGGGGAGSSIASHLFSARQSPSPLLR